MKYLITFKLNKMKRITLLVLIILVYNRVTLLSQDKKAEGAEPTKAALVIIDIQNKYLTYIPEQDKGIAMYFINAYISLFRSKGLPVIRVYHTDPTYGPSTDSEEFQYPAEIQIKPDDPMVIKNYPSSFKKTDLDKILKENNCNTLFLCGLSAVGCVISTHFAAKELDYKVFMLKDAIMSHNSDYTDNIETMFGAVDYEAVSYMLDLIGK
jgi:nicotinamidase-related amidase